MARWIPAVLERKVDGPGQGPAFLRPGFDQRIASENHASEFGVDPAEITRWHWPF